MPIVLPSQRRRFVAPERPTSAGARASGGLALGGAGTDRRPAAASVNCCRSRAFSSDSRSTVARRVSMLGSDDDIASVV